MKSAFPLCVQGFLLSWMLVRGGSFHAVLLLHRKFCVSSEAPWAPGVDIQKAQLSFVCIFVFQCISSKNSGGLPRDVS